MPKRYHPRRTQQAAPLRRNGGQSHYRWKRAVTQGRRWSRFHQTLRVEGGEARGDSRSDGGGGCVVTGRPYKAAPAWGDPQFVMESPVNGWLTCGAIPAILLLITYAWAPVCEGVLAWHNHRRPSPRRRRDSRALSSVTTSPASKSSRRRTG